MTKVVEDARNFLRQFKAMVDIAQSISDMGNLEDVVNGLTQQKYNLEKAIATGNAKIDQQKLDIADANVRIEEARKLAEKITSDAGAKATEIVSDAQSQSVNIIKDGELRVAALNEDATALSAQVEELKQQIKDLEAKKDATQKSIDNLLAKLSK